MRINSRSLTVIVCSALAVLIWLVFGQTVHYPSINYDDPGYVFANPDVAGGLNAHSVVWAFTHVHGGNWHPLTSLSHMLDCQLFGLNAGYHHLVNVVLHALAAILLFLWLRQMTGGATAVKDSWRCAFVAAVFAIHPLRVESVAWISERKDVLSAVFFMLTLAAYVGYTRRPTLVRYVLTVFVFGLGLLAKPMLVTIPVLMLLLDYWPLGRVASSRSLGKLALEKLPFIALSVASSIATLIAQKQAVGSYASMPVGWRLTNAIVSIFIYIRQTIWPNDLAIFYPHPEDHLPVWAVVASAVAFIGISIIVFRLRQRRPYLLVGWAWYVVMLLPVLGVIQVGLQGHADRYTYLPQIGLLIALAWSVGDFVASALYLRPVIATGAAAVVLALAWCSRQQTSYWRDSESLWAHTIAVTAANDIAETNLSEILIREGRNPEAVRHAEEAIRIRPDNAQAHNNLALGLLRTGRISLAIVHFKRSLELRPEGVNAASTLAWVLATSPDPSLRDAQLALALAQEAVRLGGASDPDLLHTLAASYAEAGRFQEAIATANQALQLAQSKRDPTLIKELELNLANYEKHLPLRDPGLTNADTF